MRTDKLEKRLREEFGVDPKTIAVKDLGLASQLGICDITGKRALVQRCQGIDFETGDIVELDICESLINSTLSMIA